MYVRRKITAQGYVAHDPDGTPAHPHVVCKLQCGHLNRRPARTGQTKLRCTRLPCRICPQVKA